MERLSNLRTYIETRRAITKTTVIHRNCVIFNVILRNIKIILKLIQLHNVIPSPRILGAQHKCLISFNADV